MFNGLGIPAVTPLMSYTSKTFRGNEKLLGFFFFLHLPSTLAALSFHINEAGREGVFMIHTEGGERRPHTTAAAAAGAA